MISGYYQTIEEAMKEALSSLGEKTPLRDACEYSLFSGGKRFRPIIILLIGEALGHKELVIPAAIALEFFHTSSLIIDDLPCMDDEMERRNRPTLHREFGEGTALLAAYSLVIAAYEKIGESAKLCQKVFSRKNSLCLMGLEILSRSAGIQGATMGQYLDLYPPDQKFETILKIIEQKTCALFESAFCLGWLFGGGRKDRLEKLKNCGRLFGYAFQIADDLADQKQDLNKQPNIANIFGVEVAQTMLKEKIESCRKQMQKLSIYSEGLEELLQKIVKKSLTL